MHRFLLVITLLLGFTAPAAAQEPPKVTTLFSRDLSDIPGKEGTMLIVEYPPGGADPVHRHNANALSMCWKVPSSCRSRSRSRSPSPWSNLL
jgi:hypothetical protein